MSQALAAELEAFLADAIGVDGALVATTDGLLLASTVTGREPDVLAAMCSVTSGLSSQFAATLGLGASTSTVIQAGDGCVAVHPLLDNAILLVYSHEVANVALLHLAVRQASTRLTSLLAD